MKKNGFTIIEVIIVIVIIGIISSLVTVQLTRTQLVARDKERADDISTIKLALEAIYETGQYDGKAIPTDNTGTSTTAAPLGYPSTVLVSGMTSPIDSQAQAIMDAIGPEALKTPRDSKTAYPYELRQATNSTDIVGDVAGGVSLNGSNRDQYVYQPLKADGTRCTLAVASSTTQMVIAPRLANLCQSFKLYYYSEAKEQIIKVESNRSSADGVY